MKQKQMFLEAVLILAPSDQIILEAAQRVDERRLPLLSGGAALEFVVAMQQLRVQARSVSCGPTAHPRNSCPSLAKPDQPQLSLSQALRVKSAEYWLKLGEPAQALVEIQRLPVKAQKHAWALKVQLAVVRAIREANE